jgi:hypothetical protein
VDHESWQRDLVRAVDEAQWLAWRVGVVEGRSAQALELYVRLECIRTELEELRGSKSSKLLERILNSGGSSGIDGISGADTA